MQKVILTEGEVEALVRENKYPVEPKTRFQSRCIDGRYANSEGLPALATPGADPGELGVLLGTANKYAFDVDLKKAFEVLTELVGGVKNIQGHTDTHGDKNHILTGCGHIRHMTTDPKPYNLTEENAKALLDLFAEAKREGAQEVILQGEHQEGAVLIVRGDYAVMPQYTHEASGGAQAVQVFVHHASLADARRRVWAKKLIEAGAVTLFEGCDEEYLYEVMSEEAENHLMETGTRLARGLPIYAITFDKDGIFKVEQEGAI